MAGKKTLYQLLDIPMNASDAAIERAYQFKLQLVEDGRASLSAQDYDYRVKVLAVAKQTLLDPMARHQYDHKLMSEQPNLAATPTVSVRASNALITSSPYDQQTSRAQAMSLQADALHMQADALAVLAAQGETVKHKSTWYQDLLGGSLAPLKRVFVFIGVLGILWMIVQVTLFSRVSSQATRLQMEEKKMSRADEKAILQQHYITYGERPATVEEARLLAAAHQKRALEQREAQNAKEKQERDEEKFLEDSRRRNEQVARQLRDDEERARQREQDDKERDRDRAEMQREQADMKEQQERFRQEQQQREWQQILRRK